MPVRVGAVSYLNARPLVRGLERSPERFDLRFDLPSACASLLHSGAIDLGLIPSIEYLSGEYRVVPGIGVVSDTSSRTSVALIKVLCASYFRIAPAFVSAGPDLAAMVAEADAALLIGEPALLAPYQPLGLEKIDLGAVWKEMTGLPFVYAFWAGAPSVLTPADIRVLQAARDAGRRESDDVAAQYFAGEPEKQELGAAYLRECIRYHIGERERAALARFFALAAEIGAAPPARPLRFYGEPGSTDTVVSAEPAGARALE